MAAIDSQQAPKASNGISISAPAATPTSTVLVCLCLPVCVCVSLLERLSIFSRREDGKQMLANVLEMGWCTARVLFC